MNTCPINTSFPPYRISQPLPAHGLSVTQHKGDVHCWELEPELRAMTSQKSRSETWSTTSWIWDKMYRE